MTTRDRLWGYEFAFDHPVTLWIVVGLAGILAATPLLIFILDKAGRLKPALRSDLWKRSLSWLALTPAMMLPVLLGAAWFIGAVMILSLLCYREFSRATGLFRHRTLSAIVAIGILLLHFAAIDHWYGFFVALPPLMLCCIAGAAVLADQPRGYIQRVALACLALMLIGFGLAHLAYMGNDADYRPLAAFILLAVELNDVFAYIAGKSLGRRKLIPNTSPNKTIAGALGAVLLTVALTLLIGPWLFEGQPVAATHHLIIMGLIISLGGQLGDLVLSSVKRDLGLKDMAATIPGHGGLLDRFDSLLLVAPALFHYIGYYRGFGMDQLPRIITGPQ